MVKIRAAVQRYLFDAMILGVKGGLESCFASMVEPEYCQLVDIWTQSFLSI
jgi:hypothetical protein